MVAPPSQDAMRRWQQNCSAESPRIRLPAETGSEGAGISASPECKRPRRFRRGPRNQIGSDHSTLAEVTSTDTPGPMVELSEIFFT